MHFLLQSYVVTAVVFVTCSALDNPFIPLLGHVADSLGARHAIEERDQYIGVFCPEMLVAVSMEAVQSS